ncbi:RHS repeat-associated core domain-containing protein [Archangium violaceum]|uniref:RHS repeat-associated core domain-containing protein n=1 Tax=Archangium violaceum TaxID=83451 RepID=UPI0037C12400
MISDPVDIATGNTYATFKDFEIKGTRGNIFFRRSYNSRHEAWPYGGMGDSELPKPFGSAPLSTSGLHWWHNFYTFVRPDDSTWKVKDPNGQYLEFKAPGLFDIARNTDNNYQNRDEIYLRTNGSYSEYILQRDNRRYVYGASVYPNGSSQAFYFLTRIEDIAGSFGYERVLARVSYALPFNDCPSGNNPGTVGAPYIDKITTAEGNVMRFQYVRLWRNTRMECVIKRITLDSVRADGSVTQDTAVEYNYEERAGVEQPGRLARATWPAEGRTEEYKYFIDSFNTENFQVLRGGERSVWHLYDASTSRVSRSAAEGEDLAIYDWTDGVCDPSSTTCDDPQSRTVWNYYAGLGNGETGVAPHKRKYTVVFATAAYHYGRLYEIADSCDVSNGSAYCGALSPGTRRFEWARGTSTAPSFEYAVKDKRDNWTVYDRAYVTYTPSPVMLETRATRRGATDAMGANALFTEKYSYTYMNNSGTVAHQYPYRTEKASLLAPAGSADAVARTTQVWDITYRTLEATIRSGWTNGLEPSTGSATPQRRFSAEFQFTYRKLSSTDNARDPLLRTLEKHGPCWVADESATDCPTGTPYPVTQYYYYPGSASEPDNRRNRLMQMVQYPEGFGGRKLVTRYTAYDVYGNPTRIEDDNGSVTYVYQGGNIVSRQVGNETPTRFGYDNNMLTWVQHPQGNYEVFCYRKSTSGAGCTGGTFTSQLQWKAKSATQDGATWSEKVVLEYWNDETLKQEVFLDGSGQVRKVKKYAADAHKRPTWEQWGETGAPGAFTAAKAYDRADNLAGVGLPFNAPPAWCGGVNPATDLPASKLCSWLKYDRANRLQSIEEFPSAEPTASGVKTCFDHDAHGNVKTVVPACQTALSCEGPDGRMNPNLPAACMAQASSYQYDDFGNLVAVTQANTGSSAKGVTRYAYDARGNLIRRQTEADRSAAPKQWTEYAYDQLHRQTQVRHAWGGGTPGSQLLSQYTYDDNSSSPPADCGSFSAANSAGRLRKQTDSFGTTWYYYDIHGRVVNEVRLRAGVSSCSGQDLNAHPSTSYTYSPNGNVLTKTYPHGRVVRYTYPSGNGLEDRIRSISVDLVGTTGTRTVELIRNVRWEPYGELRAYEIVAPLPAAEADRVASVEYLLGGNGSAVPGAMCGQTRPDDGAGSDRTGRLRALWVSRAGLDSPSRTGDIYRRTYTWQADQVAVQDTCVLSTSSADAPRRELYYDGTNSSGYDQLLRLKGATSTGGAFTRRAYSYNERGDRIAEYVDGCNASASFQYETGSRQDQLLRKTAGCGQVDHRYAFDVNGRVTSKLWANDDTSTPSQTVTFGYDQQGTRGGGQDTFRSVSVNGASYGYFYDASGRRRFKSYPLGTSDEYFYDLSHHLLEDRGSATLTAGAPYPMDEYIWLGERPVAFIRSKFDATWTRQPDLVGDCQRNGEAMACGVYFVITDHIRKPVLLLDSNRKVAGAADYDPFGYPNRVQVSGGTGAGYANNMNTVLASLQQPVGPNTAVKMRVLFHSVSTESCVNASTNTLWDYASLTDSLGNSLGAQKIGGYHSGSKWSGWVGVPSNGKVDVRFTSDAKNCRPSADGCTTCDGASYPYSGVTLEAYEYQRYETGASPAWLPLRFPGQYHDAETDLFENWNRYYDPSIGRFLQPEPLLQDPQFSVDFAQKGYGVLPYSYAGNNPVRYTDPNGREMIIDDVIMLPVAIPAAILTWAVCELTNTCPWSRPKPTDIPLDPPVCMAKPRGGSCSCQHRDIFSSGGQSCQALREAGLCSGPYRGTGANVAACQSDARANAGGMCAGCLGHCQFIPNR